MSGLRPPATHRQFSIAASSCRNTSSAIMGISPAKRKASAEDLALKKGTFLGWPSLSLASSRHIETLFFGESTSAELTTK